MRGAVTPSGTLAQEALCSLVSPIGTVLSSLQLQPLSIAAQPFQYSSFQWLQLQHPGQQQQQQQNHQQQRWPQASCNQQAVPPAACLALCQAAGAHQSLLQFHVLQQSACQQQHTAGISTVVSQHKVYDVLRQSQWHLQQHQAGPLGQWQWRRSKHWSTGTKELHLHRQESSVPPAIITSSIVDAETAAELIKIVVKHGNDLNRIHIIATLTRAAALWGKTAAPPVLQSPVQQQQPTAVHETPPKHQLGGGQGEQHEQQQLLARQQLQQLMLMLAGPLQRAIPLLDCRGLASGLSAYARCQLQPPQQLLAAVVEHVSAWDGLKDAQAQQVISLGWSAVKLGCTDKRLYAAIAAAMPQHVQSLALHQVSRLLWILARADFKDTHLLQQLSNKAKQLLQQQQQQQQPAELGRAAVRRLKQQQLEAVAICNTVWGLGVLDWCDPDLVTAAAELVSEAPFVYDIKPHDAVSLLKGFAIALGTKSTLASSSGSSSSSESSSGQATAQEIASDTEGPHGATAAGSNSPHRLSARVVPAACAVAAAALRRLDETGPADVPRLIWALAAVYKAAAISQHHHQQQLSPAAAADGRAVFEQLCTALLRQWRMQAAQPTSLTVAAWGLVDARESGLAPVLLQPEQLQGNNESYQNSPPSTAVADGAAAAAGGGGDVDASPPQQLLLGIAGLVVQLSQQQALMPHHVADLAAAFERLTRLAAPTYSTTGSNCSSTDDSSTQLPDKTSEAEATAAMGSWDATVRRLEPGGCMSTAVDALAAAAEQLAAEGVAGAIDVYDVSKMLAAFGCMQVHNVSLYQGLLRHWTPPQLAACNNETLVGALRAVSVVHKAMPSFVQDGVVPVGLWQQLLGLCMQRWSRLSNEQRSKLQFVALTVPADVSQQLPELVSAFTQVVASSVPSRPSVLIEPC